MGQQFTSIAKGLNLGGFQESKEEFFEKGKKAQIGEIREWKGQKFQKQPNGGWIPVKQGTKETKKEFSAEKKEEKKKFTPEDEKWLDRFFDPMDTASAFLDSTELEKDYPNRTIEEFEKYISENGQAESEAVESLVSELHLSDKEATDLYKERSKKLLEEIKKDPEKYGFETEPENKAIAGVKDWIGDEASDQEISDVLDAVEEFVSPSMLKIQANSPLQFGEKVWDRADEIMEKYREHFDHWDGTYSMPDKQLRKILVAIMYDKR